MSVTYVKHQCVVFLPHLFFVTGSKQSAGKAIDYLHGTEQPLQAAGYEQSHKQRGIEQHHILWLTALRPRLIVSQVGHIAA